MRLRSQSYHNLDGVSERQIATGGPVPWYWRLLAVVSAVMILGGFLMLPITFDTDASIRVSNVALGVFATAIVIAGFCTTFLACIVVRNDYFRANDIFRPALVSSALGFLTVFYDFMISTRYVWNLAAILTVAAAATGTIVYAGLTIWTFRQVNKANIPSRSDESIRNEAVSTTDRPVRWQTPQYYENYVKNMFPSAAVYDPRPTTGEPPAITEEEMQRQQMLMLLLRQDQAPKIDSSSGTFKIEWSGNDESPVLRRHGDTLDSATSYTHNTFDSGSTSVSMRVPRDLVWDGVWRGVSQRPSKHARNASREDRRRQIEMGA